MAAENKSMKGPLVVAAVVFLLLWFVFGMSFFGSLVAAVAAGAIAHFAFGNKGDDAGDAVNTATAAAAGAAATATAAAKAIDPAPEADPEPAPEPEPEPEPAPAPEPQAAAEPAPEPEEAPVAEAEKPAPEASGDSTLLAGEQELASRKGTWKYDPSGN